jgi:hypothetical protein
MSTKTTEKKHKKSEEENVQLKKTVDQMDQEEYRYETVPPDGGFGWVVALAAMVNMQCFSLNSSISYDDHLSI